ncbi:MAG TPA: vitamin K epoxide reductase family protein [Gemmatimonadaceae bacterium]|nr:vitamin K epoxide reductase family protein [Gemmatimonadaceae bacterium]
MNRLVMSGLIRVATLMPLAILLASDLAFGRSPGQDVIARAVLFYSPTCPHCHVVMREHLPPLVQRFGARLRIVAIDVTTEQGRTLFLEALDRQGIAAANAGVPMLVVGGRALVGAAEIPAELPGIVERALAGGSGIGWPEGPKLRELLATLDAPLPTTATDTPAAPSSGAPAATAVERTTARALETGAVTRAAPPVAATGNSTGVAGGSTAALLRADTSPARAAPTAGDLAPTRETAGQRFERDPVGNGLAVVVLVGMLAVVALVLITLARRPSRLPHSPPWLIPVLVLLGVGIAGYLAHVESTQARAVCGPVGDCNAVQSSEYARLFGVPIGILGLLGYAAIGASWIASVRAAGATQERATGALWAFALGGVVFSIYLTFLEPFVIGATCVWCLGSAVLITAILVAATPGVLARRTRSGAIVGGASTS